ncbi:hypothetical protein Tco_0108506, partial [Tanacetum coccineum]
GKVSLGGGDSDGSGDGDDDDDDGDDGDEGDGGGEGERVLLRGGATISSAIAASIASARIYGARTVFLGVNIKRSPLGWSQYGRNEGVRPSWIIEVDPPRKDPLGRAQPPEGPPQKDQSQYPNQVHSQVKPVSKMARSQYLKLGHSLAKPEHSQAMTQVQQQAMRCPRPLSLIRG